MDILIAHPQDGRSKAIFAKQHDIDRKEFLFQFN